MEYWWNKRKERAYERAYGRPYGMVEEEKRKKEEIDSRQKRRGARLLEELIKCCDGKSNPIKFFSADEILEATDSFSNSNHLFGESYNSYYKWYSGRNEKHPMILIKKVSKQMFKPYFLDIAISSMVSGHKNFMKLVGCCLESEVPDMVYHGSKKHYKLDLKEQPWMRRTKIAEDIATALAYLHTAFSRPFVYVDMNLENILVDEDGVAKLCHFSRCVSIPEGETFVPYSPGGYIVQGYGLMEPGFKEKSVVSEKTDVFGIGILMQKLLSGEQRFWDLCFEEGEYEECYKRSFYTRSRITIPPRDFPIWLSESMKKRSMEEIADPKMIEEMGGISREELCRMEAFLMLSQRCIGLRGEVPTMVEVAKELKKI